MENFLAVLKAEGVPVEDDFLELWTCPGEKERAEHLLAAAGVAPSTPTALIHPFSAVTQRGWPLENFAELAERIRNETRFCPVIVGGRGDIEIFNNVRHLFGEGIVDLVGRCDLRDTIALLKRSALFVGNDSGIMHLAAAAGIPLVALFGPQSPDKFGPWSDHAKVIYHKMACSPCRQKFFTECAPSPRMKPACMEAISVDEVFQESINVSALAAKQRP